MSDDESCKKVKKEICGMVNEIKDEHALRKLKAVAKVLFDKEKSNITN